MGRVIWWVVGVAGLLLVMLVVFAITLNISRPSQAGPTVAGDVPEPPTPTPVPTATASPTATAEPTPSGVTTARAVQSALIEAGFTDVVASEGDTAWLDGYLPNFLDLGRVGDAVYAIPHAYGTPMLYYNKDIFRQAGLDPEAPPKSWAEVLDTAKTITDTTGLPAGTTSPGSK